MWIERIGIVQCAAINCWRKTRMGTTRRNKASPSISITHINNASRIRITREGKANKLHLHQRTPKSSCSSRWDAAGRHGLVKLRCGLKGWDAVGVLAGGNRARMGESHDYKYSTRRKTSKRQWLYLKQNTIIITVCLDQQGTLNNNGGDARSLQPCLHRV